MNSTRTHPIPTRIHLHKHSRFLEIVFSDNREFKLPCEYLRVYSPSAEVRGHGPGQEVLETGKETVNITAIEPVGTYAVRLCFDDGHNTGLYSWDLLYRLGEHKQELWQHYLERLAEVNYQRCKPSAIPDAGDKHTTSDS